MSKTETFRALTDYARAMENKLVPPRRSTCRTPPERLVSALEDLASRGYVIIENLLPRREVKALRREILDLLGPTGRNSFEGYKTQRIYGLMTRTLRCNPLVEHPLILDLLDELLLPNYLLSQLVAINILPGEDAQLLHHDDAVYPVGRPRSALSGASIWALDDFVADNGATRVIPASHLWGDRVVHDDAEETIAVEMPAGSMMFFVGTLWHGGGANTTDRARLGVTAQYCQPWCRTVENFSLSMPRSLVQQCSESVQRMLGYSLHPPFMGYVDGRHPRHLLTPP